jgi:hypothetical protein
MRIFERERSPPDRTPRRVVVGLLLAALASVALIAAGCGGDSDSPAVAQTPSSTTATQPSEAGDSESDNPIAFSACMRAHGVPDFPDPNATSEITSIPDSDSPHFTAALNSCRSLLPDGGVSSPEQQAQEQAALLKFAACVRAHGVPEFPDPTVAGGRARFPEGTIPRSSPRFGAAKKACRQSLAGDDASVTGG